MVVGSNNFAESILLADIYGEALKAKGIKVTYKPNIGSRETTYGLLKNGSITVLPEYNGSLLAYLDAKAAQTSLATVNAAAKAKLDSKLTLLESSPAEDKDSVTVNAATAKKYNLTADVHARRPQGRRAASWSSAARPSSRPASRAWSAWSRVYGLKFKSFKALDAGGPLTQAALKKNTVQAADIFTTDPTITKEKFVVLQDPKNLFGFANVTPLVYKSGLSAEGRRRAQRRLRQARHEDAARPWTPRCSWRARTRWTSPRPG